MSNISVVLFDLGNVLIEWDQDRLLRKIFADTNTADTPELRQHFKIWNDLWDGGAMCEDCKTQIAQYPQYAPVIQAYSDQWIVALGYAIEGTVHVLESIKQNGFRIYAASNFARDKFEEARPRMPFLVLFDGIQISGTIGLKKPQPAFFEKMMKDFDFKAEQAVFIDDLEANIAAARSLGINGVHFKAPEQLKRDINPLLRVS